MNNSEIVKVPTRTVPNILKNNLKFHRTLVKIPIETNTVLNTEQGAQVSLDSATVRGSSLRKKIVKTKVKHRSSTKRKQEYNFKDVWYELPNWDIHSFLDKKKKGLNKNLFSSVKSKVSTQKKMLKHFTKTHLKKHDVSVRNTEQKKDLPSSISHDLPKEIIPELRIYPASQKNDLNDLQNPIDFSSNEIFSNYEPYGLSNLNYLTDYTINLDETHHSLSSIHDSDIYEKIYDINGNELDIHETVYLIQDKQRDEEVSADQSLTSSECWSKEVPIFSNKKLNCSSELCCSHCLDDCVSNWVTTSEAKNNVRLKNKVLSGISDKHSIILENSIDDQENFSYSNSHTTETYANSTDDSLYGECSEQNSCSPTSETQTCFENPLENIKITDLSGETDTEENISTETPNTVEQEECNAFSDDNDTFFSKFDCDPRSWNSEEETNNNQTTILLTETNINYNKNNKGYQCLLCPLSFSTARAMAMHQAGAHGGTYIIRCESCGRLFNQKYHFNRHFIHCGRLKEPYKCDMCMKIYRHKSSLTHHLKTVHHVHYTRNRSAKFVCTICRKIYSKFGAFENHVKLHKTMW